MFFNVYYMLGTLLKALHVFSHLKSKTPWRSRCYNFLHLTDVGTGLHKSNNLPKVTVMKWHIGFWGRCLQYSEPHYTNIVCKNTSFIYNYLKIMYKTLFLAIITQKWIQDTWNSYSNKRDNTTLICFYLLLQLLRMRPSVYSESMKT